MKSIIVTETKKAMVLISTDFLLSRDLKNCWDSHKHLRGKEVEIINHDIKIPFDSDRPRYRDTTIKINGLIFYTLSEYVKEREVTTDTKKLFIPDFGNQKTSICNTIRQCLFVKGSLNCDNCICHEDNFKHLK